MAELTKRQKAFELFNQGFSPQSPEVKALKLKQQTRANYFWFWKQQGGVAVGAARDVGKGTALASGESIGTFVESRAKPSRESKPPAPAPDDEEPEEPDEELNDEEEVTPPPGEPDEEPKEKRQAEVIGGVSEVKPSRKNGKPDVREMKLATTVADDGIKCVVFLSLKSLSLYRIAAATQVALSENGGGLLPLGDFIDVCIEDFFAGRGKELGLIDTAGGKE